MPDTDDDTLLDSEREMVFEIVSVAFADSLKWRLSDGQTAFFAAIEDTEFLERVERWDRVFYQRRHASLSYEDCSVTTY